MNYQLEPAQAKTLDFKDPFEGLTSKQYQFVMLSFSGLSDVEAYRRTFGNEMSRVTAAHKAAEIAHNPLVVAKLRELREATDKQITLAPSLTREWILNGIMQLALHADKDSVKLAAFVALGKTAGLVLFREHTVIERRNRTPEDIDRELKEQLGRLAKTIDGVAVEQQSSSGGGDRRRKPKT